MCGFTFFYLYTCDFRFSIGRMYFVSMLFVFCNGIFKFKTMLTCKMSIFVFQSSFVLCNQRNIKNVSFLFEFVFLFCHVVVRIKVKV